MPDIRCTQKALNACLWRLPFIVCFACVINSGISNIDCFIYHIAKQFDCSLFTMTLGVEGRPSSMSSRCAIGHYGCPDARAQGRRESIPYNCMRWRTRRINHRIDTQGSHTNICLPKHTQVIICQCLNYQHLRCRCPPAAARTAATATTRISRSGNASVPARQTCDADADDDDAGHDIC